MDLTVAVINWNTRDLLDKCLHSLYASQSASKYKVIVVDNGSSDGSAEMVQNEYAEVKLVRNTSNVGFSKAANQAIELSPTDYTLLLNSDTEVFAGALEEIASFMSSHPDAGVAGPMLLNPDGTIQYSCRRFPTFWIAMMHAFLGLFFPSNPYSRAYKLMDWDHQSERVVDWVSGACMCVRKKALQEAGFFDEAYFMYVEDMDLCYQMHKAGWKVYYAPAAKVMHHIGKSAQQQSIRMIIEFQKSLYRFYSKMYRDSPKRYLKPLIVIGLAMRGLLMISLNLVGKLRAPFSKSA